MSGVATAIAGSAIVGGIMQSKSAGKATDAASAASAAELEFAKQQYEDWKEIFGPVQENLAQYYNNLTPDYIASMGMQNVEIERTKALDRINQSLAQRGILGSGLEAAAIGSVEMDTAAAKAKVRSEAPAEAARQKLGFLSLGYGQNPAGMVSNTLSNQSQTTGNIALMQQQAAGQAIGNAVTQVGTALAGYARGNPTPTAE